MSNLKLYIAVLDTVPASMAPVLVAHTILSAHRYFSTKEATCIDWNNWLDTSYKKVVIRVNQKEFDKVRSISETYLGHENSTLGGTISCAVVCPRTEYPNVIKFAKLWHPT